MNETQQTLKTGTVIDDKWVILEFIAKGGMGEVYRAHQLNLKRDVAIKIISREWLASIEDDEEELEQGLMRFRNEVKAMAQVRHPNVLGIYDYGSFGFRDGDKETVLEYIVMEYIPESTLRATMPEEGFYPNEEAVVNWIRSYFMPVLDGVEELHKFGTIHRDIKPENILLDRGIPKITDFGLARSCMLASVTQSIDMKGTPAYMAAEQFLDFKRTDERTDIYALGKILFEAITGKIKPTSIPFKTVGMENPDTEFFRKLDKIIREATVEDKKARMKSVTEMRERLEAAIEEWETKNRPVCEVGTRARQSSAKKILIASTVAAGVLLIALYWFGHRLFKHQGLHSKNTGIEKPLAEKTVENTSNPKEEAKSAGNLPPIIEGKDGSKLRLIPRGILSTSGIFGTGVNKTITVKPFYLDETPVTNHQFVDFLNSMVTELTVENGVVKKGDDVWLLLGEVKAGYEPITYRSGKFLISNPAHASCPVVRVSALGASAYADYYGKRLPTVEEWAFAYVFGIYKTSRKRTVNQAGVSPSSGEPCTASWCYQEDYHMDMHMEMMKNLTAKENISTKTPTKPRELPFPTPVLLYPANTYGIRGLNINISEWVQTSSRSQLGEKTPRFVIMGNAINPSRKNKVLGKPLRREPWEAFEEVGFRCSLDVDKYLERMKNAK